MILRPRASLWNNEGLMLVGYFAAIAGKVEIRTADGRARRMTIEDAWGHFQLHELHDAGSDRSRRQSPDTSIISRVKFFPPGRM